MYQTSSVCKKVLVSEAFCVEVFSNLPAILLRIKWPGVSAVFWNAVFETYWSGCVPDFLALPRRFWPYFETKFLLIFYAKD